jgi:hypothetical protein
VNWSNFPTPKVASIQISVTRVTKWLALSLGQILLLSVHGSTSSESLREPHFSQYNDIIALKVFAFRLSGSTRFLFLLVRRCTLSFLSRDYSLLVNIAFVQLNDTQRANRFQLI